MNSVRISMAFLLLAITTIALPGQNTGSSSRPSAKAQEKQPASAPAKLTVENLGQWRDLILPSTEEMAWRKIPWRSGLHTALVDGHMADKPIMLWAMNGHPLGCV